LHGLTEIKLTVARFVGPGGG